MMVPEPIRTIRIFYCYAREDKRLRDRLDRHLDLMKRSGLITTWYDREILPGTEWKREIETRLNTSDIILLLISAHFIHSDYCYGTEMGRALERHKAGEAHVIPVIVSPVEWQKTPIGALQVLPDEGKPIIKWRYRDDAFLTIARGIRVIVEELASRNAHLNIHLEPEKYGKCAARGIYELVQAWPKDYDLTLAKEEGRIHSGASFIAIWEEKQAIVFDKRFQPLRQELWGEQSELIENEILRQMEDAKRAIQSLIEHESATVVLAPYNASPDTCEVSHQGGITQVRYKDNTNLGITTNSVRAEVAAGSNMFARMFYKPKAQEAYTLSLLEINAQSQEQLEDRFAITRAIIGMGSVYLASYAMDRDINPGEHSMARTLLINLPDSLRAVNTYYQGLSVNITSGK